VLRADAAEMRQRLSPLGLQDVRLAAVQRLSHDFLAKVGGPAGWAAGRGAVGSGGGRGWQAAAASCNPPAQPVGALLQRRRCGNLLNGWPPCNGLPARGFTSPSPAPDTHRHPPCRTGRSRPSSTAAAASPPTPGASSAGARPAPGVRCALGSCRRMLPGACSSAGGAGSSEDSREGSREGSRSRAAPPQPLRADSSRARLSAGAPSPSAGVQDATLKAYLSWAGGKQVAAGRGEGKAKRKAPAAAGSAAGGQLLVPGPATRHRGLCASCCSRAGVQPMHTAAAGRLHPWCCLGWGWGSTQPRHARRAAALLLSCCGPRRRQASEG
jgi:hypothetical protein